MSEVLFPQGLIKSPVSIPRLGSMFRLEISGGIPLTHYPVVNSLSWASIILSAYPLLKPCLATSVHHETPQRGTQLRNPPCFCDCDERCEAGEYFARTSTPESVYLFALMLKRIHREIAPMGMKTATITVSTISNSKTSSPIIIPTLQSDNPRKYSPRLAHKRGFLHVPRIYHRSIKVAIPQEIMVHATHVL